MMKRTIFFVLLIFLFLYNVAFSQANHFTDLSSHWSKSAVEWGAQQGFVKGYPDGTFRPDQPVSEVEFMALLIRLFPNAAAVADEYGKESSNDQWSRAVIDTARHFNFPFQDTSPDQPIQRKEVAMMIAGVFGYHYDANGSIAFLYDHGLSHGRSGLTLAGFDPDGTLTRAEAIVFLKNMKENSSTDEMKIRPQEPTWCKSVGKYAQPTLVALGDSISFGLFLGSDQDSPSAYAFPAMMARDRDEQVINLGITGWTTKELLEGLDTPKFQNAVNQASLITLNIGSNNLIESSAAIIDKLKADPSYKPSDQEVFSHAIVSEQNFYDDFPKILEKIRQITDAPILVYTLYNPFPNTLGLDYIHQLNEQALFPINQLILDMAKQDKSVIVADAHAAFLGKELSFVRVLTKDFHPTQDGQKELARIGELSLKSFQMGE